MLSKYQDENVETQRLEINNNKNGHNRYSSHNWRIYPTSGSECTRLAGVLNVAVTRGAK